MFKKQSKKEDIIEEVKDYKLIILTDSKNTGLKSYFRDNGVNVSDVFYEIDECKDEILFNDGLIKLVIIDVGTGRYKGVGQREKLIDLLGSDDEDIKISIYTADTRLEEDVDERKIKRDIHWHKYKSTVDVLDNILSMKGKENYILDYLIEDDESDNKTLSYKGYNVMQDDSEDEMYITTFANDTRFFKLKGGNEIEKFDVVY